MKCLIWPRASESSNVLNIDTRAIEQSSVNHSENILKTKHFLILQNHKVDDQGDNDMSTEEI